jgi:hypothetical protein
MSLKIAIRRLAFAALVRTNWFQKVVLVSKGGTHTSRSISNHLIQIIMGQECTFSSH